MSTTNNKIEQEIPEWEKMGESKTPKELKEHIETMIEFNNTAKDILKDTRDWLVTNGNNTR